MTRNVQGRTSVSDIYKTVYSKVIERCIKDLVGDDPAERGAAMKYLYSPDFSQHCEIAGCPEGLLDTLDEMIQMSPVEQRFVAKKLLAEIF